MISFFFKLFLRLNSMLPLSLAHRIGSILGWLLYLIPNSSRHVAQVNLDLCFPELTDKERNNLLKESLIESGKTIAELGIIWQANTERVLHLVKSVKNEDVLKKAISKNKGVLLAMPHIGSWELVNLYAARHYPVTALYKPPHFNSMDTVIRKARQRTGGALATTDASGVRMVSKALRKGEVIVILPDQQPPLHKKNGIFAQFFNTPANTMTLLSKLVMKSDCEVVYAYTRRLKNAEGFELIFKASSENLETDNLQSSVELMNHDIEQVIRECPAQYQWTYKRFKARPDGQPRRY